MTEIKLAIIRLAPIDADADRIAEEQERLDVRVPEMLYYAQDVCNGHWDIEVQGFVMPCERTSFTRQNYVAKAEILAFVDAGGLGDFQANYYAQWGGYGPTNGYANKNQPFSASYYGSPPKTMAHEMFE